jgi:hypothetical protein
MDALLPFHDQRDTPDWPELGITHLGRGLCRLAAFDRGSPGAASLRWGNW